MLAESPSGRQSVYRARSAERAKRHLGLGMRWLKCGWRLFLRNPWLLGGMGLVAAVLIGALSLIPLVGGLLITLIAPVLLASAYLAIDAVSRQGMALPASLRLAAIKRSPKELARVFHDEERLMPTAVAAVYCLAVTLLVNILAQFVTGAAWTSRWAGLDLGSLLGVLAMALLALLIYAALAASLIYALPLVFLQDEPLIPAIGRSLKASARYVFAFSAMAGLLLAPFLLSGIASYSSTWAAHLVWVVTGTVALPVVTAGLYCSYRTIFPADMDNRD